jgi:hypothetical protein
VTAQQPPRAPLDLRRTRDVGALLSDAFSLYVREFRAFFAIAVAVVVPVNMIVYGVGLGQFTGAYDPKPGAAEALVPMAAQFFVTLPLLIAMCIYAMLDASEGRRPQAREAIQRGLDVFGPLLVVLLLYVLSVLAGLFAALIGALAAAVYFGFAMQAAVVEGRRGADALRHSFEVVRGSWWRVLGVTLLAQFLTGALTSLAAAPFLAAAESTGDAVYQLVGQTVGGVLFAPPAALITTLLYFDQRARKGV